MALSSGKERAAAKLIARAATIDPDQLDWHAARYVAAEGLQRLIKRARDGEIVPAQLPATVKEIARAGTADGACYGMIATVGGEPIALWYELLFTFTERRTSAEARRFYVEGRRRENLRVTFNPDYPTPGQPGCYVIPMVDDDGAIDGYSCHGRDIVEGLIGKYAAWLGEPAPTGTPGTEARYEQYRTLLQEITKRTHRTGERCTVELTPQLIGLEGKRVEVTDSHGDTRRFRVGRSMGPIPIHLEIERHGDSGGGAVTGAPFTAIRVL